MKRITLAGCVALIWLVSGCTTMGYDMVSFLRVVSTNPKFTQRELRGEVDNVIFDMGYIEVQPGKWKRRLLDGFILVEKESDSQPTVDVSIYIKSGQYRSRDRDTLEDELTGALHDHFSRRMQLDEVKLLRGLVNRQVTVQ